MKNGAHGFATVNGKRHRATLITAHDDGLADLLIEFPKGHMAAPGGGKVHATLPASDFQSGKG